MKHVDPCQLNAAIAAITNHLYCTLSRQDFVNLGIILSMLSRGILHMAAIEDLLNWEHRDLRAERLLREAKKRRPKPPAGAPPAMPVTPVAKEALREEGLAEEEELAQEGELLAEELLIAETEL